MKKTIRRNHYEEDRLKKLRNTQYDILKDLDILKKDDEEIEEEDIEKIYHYLNGKVESHEKWAVGSTTDIEKGKNSTYYYSSFKMVISGIEYYLYYIYYPRNDFELIKEGITSLKVVKVDEDGKYFCYWQDMKLGIFLPDEAK